MLDTHTRGLWRDAAILPASRSLWICTLHPQLHLAAACGSDVPLNDLKGACLLQKRCTPRAGVLSKSPAASVKALAIYLVRDGACYLLQKRWTPEAGALLKSHATSVGASASQG